MEFSNHARQRYQQRYSEKPKFDPNVLLNEWGFTKDDFRPRSSIHKYLKDIEAKNPGSECIVNMNKVYIIKDGVILTTYPLKKKYRGAFEYENWMCKYKMEERESKKRSHATHIVQAAPT